MSDPQAPVISHSQIVSLPREIRQAPSGLVLYVRFLFKKKILIKKVVPVNEHSPLTEYLRPTSHLA